MIKRPKRIGDVPAVSGDAVVCLTFHQSSLSQTRQQFASSNAVMSGVCAECIKETGLFLHI